MGSRLRSRWRNLRHRDRMPRDLDNEMRAIFDLLVDEGRARGLPAHPAIVRVGTRRHTTLAIGIGANTAMFRMLNALIDHGVDIFTPFDAVLPAARGPRQLASYLSP